MQDNPEWLDAARCNGVYKSKTDINMQSRILSGLGGSQTNNLTIFTFITLIKKYLIYYQCYPSLCSSRKNTS